MLRQYSERPFNTWDAIKLLALLLMFVDHLGAFIFPDEPTRWLRAIGRGAAPIFLFLAGFAASYRFKWDLFILALLMTISDVLLTGTLRTQNILVTILVSRMILKWAERKEGVIRHPYQWLFGSMAWLATMVVTVYGSFGLMFALCGYVKRKGTAYYPPHVQQRMLIITLTTFGLISQFTFQFVWSSTLIMVAVLLVIYRALSKLEVRPLDLSRYPKNLIWLAKQISIYSGYIYAFHLIALEWATGIPF